MNDFQALSARGTRVFTKLDGSVVIVPPGIEYQARDGEVEIHEIVDINIDFPLRGAITAVITLYPSQDVIINALPQYVLTGPAGEKKSITAVHFDDGSVWSPDGSEYSDVSTMADEYRKYKHTK